jgi:hypothetical protein
MVDGVGKEGRSRLVSSETGSKKMVSVHGYADFLVYFYLEFFGRSVLPG